MWVQLTHRTAVACLVLALSNASFAQLSSSADLSISFDQAIEYTMERNPELIAFGFQIEAQHGRVQQSELRPGTTLGITLENAVGTGIYSGADAAEATISLAWILERGKRESRVDAALARVSLLESEADIRRLDAAAQTARIFLQTLANQAHLKQTAESVALAEQTVQVVMKRVQSGRTPEADFARAEVELSRMQLEREDFDHDLQISLRRLAAQWGDTEPDFDRVRGDMARLPVPDSYSSLQARIENNPSLGRYVNEQRLREAELRVAESTTRPDWRVTAGIRQLQQTDDQALMAGITIPLGGKSRNHGQLAEARAALAMTEADKTATRIQIETRLFSLYQELQHSLHRATALRDDILPRIESALVATERAYNMGRYSYFELRTAQNEALQARTAAIVAVIDAHRNVIEIERLTGTTMSSPAKR
jgi:cobalt-zinc-cadmium efflux system outer membrane protein